MRVPEQYRDFNVPEVERLQILRNRANEINKAARRLREGMFSVFFSRAQAREQKRLREEMQIVELALVELDYEIIDFFRVSAVPNQGPYITPEWFAVQMRVRAYVRDAVLHYVHDARKWISDIHMTALVRATLVVSALALLVTAGAFVYGSLQKEKIPQAKRQESSDLSNPALESSTEYVRVVPSANRFGRF